MNIYGPADLADLYENTGNSMLSPITHVSPDSRPTLTLLGTSDRGY